MITGFCSTVLRLLHIQAVYEWIFALLNIQLCVWNSQSLKLCIQASPNSSLVERGQDLFRYFVSQIGKVSQILSILQS